MTDKAPLPPRDDEVLIDRIKALVELEAGLTEAANLFSLADDTAGRLGARRALVAVHRFLCDAEVPHALQGPIVALLGGLEGLDQGKTLQIMKAAPIGRGKRPVTASVWMARTLAAAGLELRYLELKKQGEEKALDEAAGWVARATRSWPDLNPPGGIEELPALAKKRAKKWRAEMKERPVTDPMVVLFSYLVAPERGLTARQLLDAEPLVWGIRTKKSQ